MSLKSRGRTQKEEGRRQKEEGKRPSSTIAKSQLRRSPSTTLHPVLTASQPYFSLCQFSS
ncbi:hypothetical protein QUB30_23850 [Microcoleus sp. BROC3]